MSSWELYWILRLDAISEFLGVLAVTTAIEGVILLLLLALATTLALIGEEDAESIMWFLRRLMPKIAITLAVLWSVYLLLPTTKEMVLIKVVPPLVNSEVAQKIPNDLTDLYNWAVKEIKAKAKEEVGK